MWKTAGRIALTACLAGMVLFPPAVVAQAPERPLNIVSQGSATISASDQYLLRSEILGREILVQVARPYNLSPITLQPGDKGTPHAAVYVVDAFLTFGPFATLARSMALEGLVEPAYIVAIGYPTESLLDLIRQRTRDLVHLDRPNVSLGMPGGGGGDFETFLAKELRPFIESRYAVKDGSSYLAGHSIGGLFTATALVNNPAAFDGYLIGSPSLQLDPELAGRARSLVTAGARLPVFIGAGDEENNLQLPIDAYEAALIEGGAGVDVKRMTFENETHTSMMGAWISSGLRRLLKPAAGANE